MIGARALLRLSAAIDPADFLRAQRLRPIPAPRTTATAESSDPAVLEMPDANRRSDDADNSRTRSVRDMPDANRLGDDADNPLSRSVSEMPDAKRTGADDGSNPGTRSVPEMPDANPPGEEDIAKPLSRSVLEMPDAAPAPHAINPRLRIFLVESLADEDGLSVAGRLAAVEGVDEALPDLFLERRRAAEFEVPPNDPRYRGQVYLSRLKMERVWQVTAGDRDTTVVVIDDGCDMQHPDLKDAMLGGIDVIDEDDDARYTPNEPGNEHGTACAGIIAAVGNNDLGITGACPRCTLRCVRLFGKNHALIPISADLAAFDYVFDTRAAVVSNSWGFAEPQPVPSILRTAIEELLHDARDGRGTLVVFAAGNENRRIDDDELAAIPGVVNVGAVNNFDEAAPFSNSGNSVALTAPTGSLTTDISGNDGADPGDYTSLFGGTSSACPVVAGVGALLMSATPDRNAREIAEILRTSARTAPFAQPNANGHDPLYGYGILDPVAAFEAAGLEVPAPPPPRDAGTADPPDGGAPDAAADRGDDSGCTTTGPVANDGFELAFLAAALGTFALRRRGRTRRTTQ